MLVLNIINIFIIIFITIITRPGFITFLWLLGCPQNLVQCHKPP